MDNMYYYLAIAAGIIALLFAAIKFSSISKKGAGNERMKEISGFIHDGAMAYLSRQYKALIIFVVVVCVILGFAITAGFLGSSSGIPASTLPTKSAPTSAALV